MIPETLETEEATETVEAVEADQSFLILKETKF